MEYSDIADDLDSVRIAGQEIKDKIGHLARRTAANSPGGRRLPGGGQSRWVGVRVGSGGRCAGQRSGVHRCKSTGRA